MTARYDEDMNARALLRRHRVQPCTPRNVLEHDAIDLWIELPTEGAGPFEEPVDQLDVIAVGARTGGYGALGLGEAGNGEECQGVLPVIG